MTCGWKKPELPLETVLRYWRDVHSPAIARRRGIWEYRHYQFEPVQAGALPAAAGIEQACPADAQLMWTSDVRYADEQGLAAFGDSPSGEAKALLLADIELIVERSTTYKVLGDDGRTLRDVTRPVPPQGPARALVWSLFLRRRGEESAFRAAVCALAEDWAQVPGVTRLRRSLFETPDMEAERKAGYPVKTHPTEQQYQAWIDLAFEEGTVLRRLPGLDRAEFAGAIAAVHAYPVRAVYTSVYAGAPTIVGLRGFPAWEAIEGLGADNARHATLLSWMYGDVARGGGSSGGPA